MNGFRGSGPVGDRGVAAVLLMVAAVSLAACALPWFGTRAVGIGALLALLGSLWHIGAHRLRRRLRLSDLLILIGAGLVMLPFSVIARVFGRVDMLSFLFHLRGGIGGMTLAGLGDEVTSGIVSIALFGLAAVGLNALAAPRRRVLIWAAALLVVANPAVRYGLSAAVTPPVRSGLDRQLVQPRINADVATRPDIVIVYVEGFDRQYLDQTRFPGVRDGLEQVRQQALDFTNISQIEGTGWSIAGLVATQCGVPLVPNGLRNSRQTETARDFMTGRVCLGDVLADLGYQSAHVVGADLGFGGLGHFLTSHRYGTVLDRDGIAALWPADEVARATAGWALDDQMLYATALGVQTRLLGAPDPYAMVVETVALHGKAAILSRACDPSGQAQIVADVPRVALCATQELVRFLDDVRAQQGNRPLRIVVLSDHLAHYDASSAPLADRRNMVMVLGPGTAGRRNDATGTMIDIYPTLLEWFGFAKPPVAAGLGRSLIGSGPTLFDQMGPDAMNTAILNDPWLATAIWQAPTAPD